MSKFANKNRIVISGLYLALMDLESPSGYRSKLRGQIAAFSDAGIEMEIISLGAKSSILSTTFTNCIFSNQVLKSFKQNPINSRIQLYGCAWKYIFKHKCSLLYLRHALTDPVLLAFLILLKLIRPSISIIAEIPTYPYDNISQLGGNCGKRILELVDRRLRKYLHFFYERIVSIGYESDIFNIKTISISNGVDIDDYPLKTNLINRLDNLRLVGVGNVLDYHGYDRIIIMIRDNELTRFARSIEFNIVGPDTPALAKLKGLVVSSNLSSKVIFHGPQYGIELDEIFSRCDIAVSSLAWHRVNVFQHSNLKTREYMARGIPFIYAGLDEQVPSTFEYACRVPLDDSPLNVEMLFGFAQHVLSCADYSREMREYAESQMSWIVTLAPVIRYIKDRCLGTSRSHE
jgi:glycosyltransferase involved in cell wall biosynthesis